MGDLPGSTYYHRVRTVRRARLVPSRGCKSKRRIGRRRRGNLLRCDDHGNTLREFG